MQVFLQHALKYHALGFVVIPFYNTDGGVKFPPWAGIESQEAKDVRAFFKKPSSGIAIRCTDGLEVIDIDVKHDPTGQIYEEYIAHLQMYASTDDVLPKCLVQKTKSGGYHIFYKAPNVEGNRKLCRKAGTREAVIETRGNGGLVFVAPTPGYEIIQGSFQSIPEINEKTRNRFISCATELDEPPIEEVRIEGAKPKTQYSKGEVTPWDDYNEKTDIFALMESYGWKILGGQKQYTKLNRPGAKHNRGVDATIIDGKFFYPFSTSTQFNAQKAYTPFAVYAVIEHNGNYKEATKTLYYAGYGSRVEVKKEIEQEALKKEQKKETDTLLQKVLSSKYDNTKIIKEEEAVLKLKQGGKSYKIAGKGMIGGIVGQQKSGKSLITSAIVASGLAHGWHILNFNLNIEGRVVFFDTEQSDFFFQMTQKRIHRLARINGNCSRYDAYWLRPYTWKERVNVINEILRDKEIALIVIDGIKDLCKNFNDETAATETIQQVMKWSSDTGALILNILHLTKSERFVRGHLGTELQNKADFIIEGRKTGDNEFHVLSRESRFAPFPQFTYHRDEKTGDPVTLEDEFSNL